MRIRVIGVNGSTADCLTYLAISRSRSSVFARQQTDLAERRKVFLGAFQVALEEIGLADVLMRASVTWV